VRAKWATVKRFSVERNDQGPHGLRANAQVARGTLHCGADRGARRPDAQVDRRVGAGRASSTARSGEGSITRARQSTAAAEGPDLATKKPRKPKREPPLEVSPTFFDRPKRIVIARSPPDIPDKLIPVLRKKPIVIRGADEPAFLRRLTDRVVAGQAPAPRRASVPKPAAARASTRPGTRKAGRSAPTKPAARSKRVPPAVPPVPARKRVDQEIQIPADDWTPAKFPKHAPAMAVAPAAPRAPVRTAPARPARTRPIRKRGLSTVGLFGTFLAVLAITGIIVNVSLPWIRSTPSNAVGEPVATHLGEGLLGRAALDPERAANPYFDRLVGWPMLCFAAWIAMGLALAGLDELNGLALSTHRVLQTLLLSLVTFVGFILTLTGTRWVGLYVNAVLDDGPSPIHLHVVPYANLAMGLLVLPIAYQLLARRWGFLKVEFSQGHFGLDEITAPLHGLVVCGAALLLMPLLPFGSVATGAGTWYVGEALLSASVRYGSHMGIDVAAEYYGWARGLLWLVFYVCAASAGLGLWERAALRPILLAGLVFTFGILGLPILIGFVFALIFEAQFLGGSGLRLSINVMPPIAYTALALLYARYMQEVFVPYLDHARRTLAD
jgi:hypothetical protein